MPVQCTKCPYLIAIRPGERPPPWCPRCGAELKRSAEATTPAAAPAHSNSAAQPGTDQTSVGMPPPAAPVAKRPTPIAQPPAPGADETALSSPVSTNPDLASSQEVFGPKPLWPAVAVLAAIVCFAIAAIAATQVINPPPARAPQVGAYGVLALFALGGLVSAYVAFRLWGQKYAVFADHLVAWQAFQPTTIRWEQIRDVFQQAHPAWTKYRVFARGGRTLTITAETQNHKRLGDLIGERVAERLLPGVLAELEAGRTVRFGRMHVTSGGVDIDGQFEPWHRIGELTFTMNPTPVHGSMLSNMVHVRIGASLIELGDIPNYRLFTEVARHMFPACVGG